MENKITNIHEFFLQSPEEISIALTEVLKSNETIFIPDNIVKLTENLKLKQSDKITSYERLFFSNGSVQELHIGYKHKTTKGVAFKIKFKLCFVLKDGSLTTVNVSPIQSIVDIYSTDKYELNLKTILPTQYLNFSEKYFDLDCFHNINHWLTVISTHIDILFHYFDTASEILSKTNILRFNQCVNILHYAATNYNTLLTIDEIIDLYKNCFVNNRMLSTEQENISRMFNEYQPKKDDSAYTLLNFKKLISGIDLYF